jgi:RES domain-containing protein
VSDATHYGSFAGPVFRQCREKYASAATPVTLVAGSLRDGGRFNPAGEFGALYASLDRSTAIAELCRQIIRGGFSLQHFFPRVMLQFDVDLPRVYDLTSTPAIDAVGLTSRDLVPVPTDPDDAGHAACQRVARTLRDRGCEAIRYPSATRHGENIAIFVDRLGPTSIIRLTSSLEVVLPERAEQMIREGRID